MSSTLALPIGLSASICWRELGSKGSCFIPRRSADPVARGEDSLAHCGPFQAKQPPRVLAQT
ncbi:MAG: hypothetical protein WBE20_09070 [Candidatus Acidiferrales bacterium]